MRPAPDSNGKPKFGLSARLLVMTIIFVMIAEVLIFVPSVSRYRQSHLREHIAKAHIAVLALEATPDQMVSQRLEEDLLYHAQAYGIVLREGDRKRLVLSQDMPPAVDIVVRPLDESIPDMIIEAFAVLFQSDNRITRVIGTSPRAPEAEIEVIIDEKPMRYSMYAFAGRILTLSIIISLITASLVYLTLQWLMVLPIRRLTQCMMDFRHNPEDPATTMSPSRRRDEIGVAERELGAMQTVIRDALQQKSRLATLGAAVAKINHDLRNALGTAVIASDALTASGDPEVKRVAARLFGAIDRAVTICTQSLRFARGEKTSVDTAAFNLDALLTEVITDVTAQFEGASEKPQVAVEVSPLADQVEADREQMSRVLTNLILNAIQCGANRIVVRASANSQATNIEIIDNGPGIPAQMIDKLFIPFAASTRENGTGLGLAISRDIARAHGGDLTLAETGEAGTTFRIHLPRQRIAAAA